ncbi:MAG: hypothetical protein GXY83_05460 [Rhodopirellula sp.]|nr:hypothetical protein [Rhodopirellula sp.]
MATKGILTFSRTCGWCGNTYPYLRPISLHQFESESDVKCYAYYYETNSHTHGCLCPACLKFSKEAIAKHFRAGYKKGLLRLIRSAWLHDAIASVAAVVALAVIAIPLVFVACWYFNWYSNGFATLSIWVVWFVVVSLGGAAILVLGFRSAKRLRKSLRAADAIVRSWSDEDALRFLVSLYTDRNRQSLSPQELILGRFYQVTTIEYSDQRDWTWTAWGEVKPKKDLPAFMSLSNGENDFLDRVRNFDGELQKNSGASGHPWRFVAAVGGIVLLLGAAGAGVHWFPELRARLPFWVSWGDVASQSSPDEGDPADSPPVPPIESEGPDSPVDDADSPADAASHSEEDSGASQQQTVSPAPGGTADEGNGQTLNAKDPQEKDASTDVADSPRVWTDATGQHKTRAVLIETDGVQVRLKKDDGTEVTVPLNKLSDADRQYVRSRSNRERSHTNGQ